MTDDSVIEEAATMLRHYGYGHLADGIEAVFEKAHAPTDDEREAERIAYLDARQAAMQQDRVDWYADYDADPGIAGNAFERGWGAAVDGRFARHSEPSDEQWCGGLRICSNAEHDHQEPQGEPSDAQVLAARNAYQEAHEANYDFEDCIHAALRAAGAVGAQTTVHEIERQS